MFRTQAALDQSVRALETGDFALYREVNDVPCALVLDDETRLLDSEAALRRNFEALAALAAGRDGQRLVRTVRAEMAVGEALIHATVATHLERDGRILIDPFHSAITYRLVGDHWRAALVVNPITGRAAGIPGQPEAPAGGAG